MATNWTQEEKIAVTVIIVICLAVTTFLGQGFLYPIFINAISPKYTPFELTILMQPNSHYSSCIHWQKIQEYRINTTTDGTPITMQIVNISNFKKFSEGQLYFALVEDTNIIANSIPYKPPTDDVYNVVFFNPNNRSVVVSLSIEAQKTCRDEIL